MQKFSIPNEHSQQVVPRSSANHMRSDLHQMRTSMPITWGFEFITFLGEF